MSEDDPQPLAFLLLGRLEVLDRGTSLPLGGDLQRSLLALLALQPNELLDREWVVDVLWEGSPPATAGASLRNCIWRLRKLFSSQPGILETHPGGYLLRLDPGQRDLDRLEAFAEAGKRQLAAGDAVEAAAAFRQALALWRGPPLFDLRFRSFAQAELARIEEMRLVVLSQCFDSELAAGRHEELIPELEAAFADNPERERFASQLMLALYRSGRQAEALEVFQRLHTRLDAELGVRPSPELQDLQRAILVQDETLDLNRPPAGSLRAAVPRRRWLALGSAVAAAGVAASVLTTGWASGAAHPLPLRGDSLVRIDPRTNTVTAAVRVGAGPVSVVVGRRAVWVANVDDRTISQIDPRTNHVVATITLPTSDAPNSLAAGPGSSVWVAGYGYGVPGRHLWLYDASTRTTRQANTPPVVPYELISGDGGLWMDDYSPPEKLLQLSATGAVRSSIPMPGGVGPIGAGDDRLWAVRGEGVVVYRLGGRSLIAVGHEISSLAVDHDRAWITDPDADTVQRIDSASDRVTETVRVGRTPTAVAVGSGSVWAANSRDGTVTRVDPDTANVTTIAVGGTPQGLAVGAGGVWVTVGLP